MGREPLDIERKGSLGRRTGRSVYPVPAQTATYEQMPPHSSRTSWIIPLFVVANIIVFIVTMFINNCPKNSPDCNVKFLKRLSFQPFSENPLLGPSASTLKKMGALDSVAVVHEHQGWRLISCIWLHAGVFHILANMLSLLFIGIRLEQEFGFIRIGLLYLISGFGGSLMSALFIQDRISVGASGALFGLLGAMLSELLTNWTIYSNKLAALVTLLIIIALNLAVGILPHVDNFAHIGGFISGFLLGFVLLVRPQLGWVRARDVLHDHPEIDGPVKSKHKIYQYVFWVLALLLLIAGYTAAIIVLFKGVDANKKCSWCHYLSCVPTKHWHCNQKKIQCQYDFGKGYLTITCDGNGSSREWSNVVNQNANVEYYCRQSCG